MITSSGLLPDAGEAPYAPHYTMFATLPVEIIADIFIHLRDSAVDSFLEDLALARYLHQLSVLVVVCRQWTQIAVGLPDLWTTLALTPGASPSTLRLLQTFIRRSQPLLVNLLVAINCDIGPAIIFTQCITRWRSITFCKALDGHGDSQSPIFPTMVAGFRIPELVKIQTCPGMPLDQYTYVFAPKLQTITSPYGPIALPLARCQAPLRGVKIGWNNQEEWLRVLDLLYTFRSTVETAFIIEFQIFHVPLSPPCCTVPCEALRTLHLECEVWNTLCALELPVLEELYLRNCQCSPGPKKLRMMPSLVKLTMRGTEYLDGEPGKTSLQALLSAAPNVVVCHVPDTWRADTPSFDAEVLLLRDASGSPAYCQALEEAYLGTVGLATIKKLLYLRPTLRRVNFSWIYDDCGEHISVEEWASMKLMLNRLSVEGTLGHPQNDMTESCSC